MPMDQQRMKPLPLVMVGTMLTAMTILLSLLILVNLFQVQTGLEQVLTMVVSRWLDYSSYVWWN